MELVYLWVDKYKNIEKQGFNLSPRFRCNYNSDTNELTIEENADYIEIFPKNVNITAIVGKNGSGKSNLIKLIYKLLFIHNHRNLQNFYWDDGRSNADLIRLSLSDLTEKDFKSFIILERNENFYKIDSEHLKHKLQQNGLYVRSIQPRQYIDYEITLSKSENLQNFECNIDIFSIYYNYSLDTWQDGKSYWIETIYHRKDDYKLPLLIEPYKKGNNIDLDLLQTLSNQRILLFYSIIRNDLQKHKITSFFNPNVIAYKYAHSRKNEKVLSDLAYEIEELLTDESTAPFYSKNNNILVLIEKNYVKLVGKYISFFENLAFAKNLDFTISIEHLDNLEKIIELYERGELKRINLLYIFFKIVEKREKIHSIEVFHNLKLESFIDEFENNYKSNKFIENFLSKWDKEISKFVELANLDEKSNYDSSILKIIIALLFHKKSLYKQLEPLRLETTNQIQINRLISEPILRYFPAWMEVDFKEDEKSLSTLSTGEQLKFQFLIGLLYQLRNIYYSKQYSSVQIFLDEVEFGQHPEWQRSFLNDILLTIEQYRKIERFDLLVNLYFLTHSPFLISDLPKQNIIFLDKDENGKCRVVDGLKEKKETFGANIHTLLSDSFFMEDGLIGKYAEEKINDVINYFNGKESSIKNNNEAQKIINIIGEPIIKKELQKMLDSKRLEKVQEIDVLKRNIAVLQARLEKLENEKDNNN